MTQQPTMTPVFNFTFKRVYNSLLHEHFKKWYQSALYSGFLKQGSLVQFRLHGQGQLFWGKITSNKHPHYNVEHIQHKDDDLWVQCLTTEFKDVPRNSIFPVTRLIRSGTIIDLNDLCEPPTPEGRFRLKWRPHPRPKDFD